AGGRRTVSRRPGKTVHAGRFAREVHRLRQPGPVRRSDPPGTGTDRIDRETEERSRIGSGDERLNHLQLRRPPYTERINFVVNPQEWIANAREYCSRIDHGSATNVRVFRRGEPTPCLMLKRTSRGGVAV